ncbi:MULTISPECIES: DUF6653 family protein [Halorussus]|uniref:DUF6653 family protein n=1 Tax=Halorussus TaxID=1070314 RepID=UPI00209DB854|nr:DUF6653 family protein [Halorussus vallis]USZ74841.1 hypothetical protein NGM07_15530 [Halorussus vallis]
MPGKITDVMDDEVWGRHSNPKSGWSRFFAGPVLVLALCYRKWSLVILTALFVLVNPVLFPEPDEELDDWMYKVVKAEERWTADGNRLVGLGYPQVVNTLSIPVMLWALYAAYERKPISSVSLALASQGLNQWCMKEIVEHYEEIDSN